MSHGAIVSTVAVRLCAPLASVVCAAAIMCGAQRAGGQAANPQSNDGAAAGESTATMQESLAWLQSRLVSHEIFNPVGDWRYRVEEIRLAGVELTVRRCSWSPTNFREVVMETISVPLNRASTKVVSSDAGRTATVSCATANCVTRTWRSFKFEHRSGSFFRGKTTKGGYYLVYREPGGAKTEVHWDDVKLMFSGLPVDHPWDIAENQQAAEIMFRRIAEETGPAPNLEINTNHGLDEAKRVARCLSHMVKLAGGKADPF